MSTAAYKKEEPRIPVDPNVPDLSKSHYVIAKVEMARAFMAKHPLPKEEKPAKKGK
jgi:hypothetical protein